MTISFYTNIAKVGNFILVRGYDKQGNQVSKRVKYKPSLFVNHPSGEYSTLEGHQVKRIIHETMSDATDYLKRSKDIANRTVYGYEQFVYPYIQENFSGKIKYNHSFIRIANIDIETASDEGMPDIETANKPITAITAQMGDSIISIGCGAFEPTDDDVTYIQCESEEELITTFLDAWEWYNPDVVTGWNIEGFDIPYIVNRTRALLGPASAKRLSPWKHLREREVFNKNKMRTLYYPTGVALLDYMKIYKKMELEPRESYSLNFIASVEVGAKKIDYSEYENLFALYKQNFQKFMEYNITDVRLVSAIEKKKRMLDLTFQMAYAAHCNFEDINSPVRMWEAISYNDLMDRGIVFPPRHVKSWSDFNEVEEEEQELEGGYVKDPKPGLYRHVVSIDLKSSYPHQIMMYNISPETHVGYRQSKYAIEDYLAENTDTEYPSLVDKDVVIAASGCLYRKDIVGFFPRLLSEWFDQRDKFKQVQTDSEKLLVVEEDKREKLILENRIADYQNKQKVYKVALNSLYGAMSNEYFRFYSYDMADSVTACGRLAVRWAEKHVNAYLNEHLFTKDVDYVIAIDTDSLYINFGAFIEKKYGAGPFDTMTPIINLLDEIVKNKILPHIDDCYREMQKRVNASTQKMKMNRESIADVGIWTGKKRYVMNVWDKEGIRYEKPKIKITGIDSVRSSTPSSCRGAINDLIKVIIYNDEETAQKFIADFYNRFQTLPFDEIAFPRGINGMEQYADDTTIYKKGTPIQVRGALVYNQILKEKEIHNFSPLYDGDKAKFCYLLTPNPVRSYVITVPHALPKVFGLDSKIDRDKQFEIGFLNPVTKILDAVGWKTEDSGNTLDDFMNGSL